jgi:hypothetical protein
MEAQGHSVKRIHTAESGIGITDYLIKSVSAAKLAPLLLS